jgi:protein TonB
MPKTRELNVEVTALSNLTAPKKVTEQAKDVFVKKIEPIKAAIKFVPPVIKPDDQVQEVDTIRTQEDLNLSKSMISTVDVAGVTDDPDAVDATEVNQIIEEPKEEPPFQYVEQMPEFPEGDISTYLAKNTKYPEVATDNGISGRVFVQFIVGKTGEITDVTVVRGVDPSLDQEAVRVIKKMPRWKPGKQNGVPVRVIMVVPVFFKLN